MPNIQVIFQDLKSQLLRRGVKVETLSGGQPIDVMKHLGKRNGYKAVVWRISRFVF